LSFSGTTSRAGTRRSRSILGRAARRRFRTAAGAGRLEVRRLRAVAGDVRFVARTLRTVAGGGRLVGNRGGRLVDGNLGEVRLAMMDSLPVKLTV